MPQAQWDFLVSLIAVDMCPQLFDWVKCDDLHGGGASGDRLGVEPGSKAIGGFRFLLDVRALW